MNVRMRTNPQGAHAICIAQGMSPAQMPTINPVGAPEAVNEFEGFRRLDAVFPQPQALFRIIGMNESGPAKTVAFVWGNG
jgi:hypothetical protein